MPINPIGAMFMLKEDDFKRYLVLTWKIALLSIIPYIIIGQPKYYYYLYLATLLMTIGAILVMIFDNLVVRQFGDVRSIGTGFAMNIANIVAIMVVGATALIQGSVYSFGGYSYTLAIGSLIFCMLVWSSVLILDIVYAKDVLGNIDFTRFEYT